MNKFVATFFLLISLIGLAAQAQNTFPSSGNVGIGTTSPSQMLEVDNGNLLLWDNNHSYPVTAGTYYGSKLSFSQWVNAGAPGSAEIGSIAKTAWSHGWLPSSGLYFATSQQDTVPAVRMVLDNVGNLGIGTISPGSKLEVNGNVALTSGSGASITFADGTVQSTAWTGTTCGGDYAESVDVSGDRTKYEPGDLMVVDSSAPGRFLKSAEPYSTLVAGIYSTKPGLVGRRQLTDRSNMKDEVPMAMTGIVPTKVSTENGRIKIGDLLVSSSKLGYAMKGTDRSQMLGAVVGKALAPLDSGSGVIEVLVTLQ